MEPTTVMRLGAQIALVLWCLCEAVVLLASRGRWVPVTGARYAIAGLLCFAGWMFISAISIRTIEMFPRATFVPAFAILQVCTAVLAWIWLVISVRNSFKFTFHRSSNGA